MSHQSWVNTSGIGWLAKQIRLSMCLVIVFYFAVLHVRNAAAQGTTATVVTSGQSAPGFPGGTFEVFNLRGLSNTGHVLFEGNVLNSSLIEGNSYPHWLGQPGNLAILKYSTRVSTHAWVNASGAVSVVDDSGIWTGFPGSLTRATSLGDIAPGAPGATFKNYGGGFLTDSGQLSFDAQLGGDIVNSSNDRGIWMGPPNAVALVVREGQAVPGIPDSVFRSVGGIHVSDSQVAFSASLLGPGFTNDYRQGVWVGNSAGINLVARPDEAAPGLGSGVTFSSVRLTDFSDAGHVALATGLAGSGVDASNYTALWVGPPGNLNLVARTGDQAPGLPDGVTFSSFGSPKINALGQIAVVSGLAGPGVTDLNDAALWWGTPGNLSLIAREGDQVPDAPQGVVFHHQSSSWVFSEPELNSQGRVAFIGAVSGPGINDFNNEWVWLRDSVRLHRIASGQNGGIALNDRGQIAYVTAGPERIQLFTPTPVPEPTTLILLVMGLAAVSRVKLPR